MHVASRDRTYKGWMLWDDGGNAFKRQTSPILSAADLASLRIQRPRRGTPTPCYLMGSQIVNCPCSGLRPTPPLSPASLFFSSAPGSFPSAQTALTSSTLKRRKTLLPSPLSLPTAHFLEHLVYIYCSPKQAASCTLPPNCSWSRSRCFLVAKSHSQCTFLDLRAACRLTHTPLPSLLPPSSAHHESWLPTASMTPPSPAFLPPGGCSVLSFILSSAGLGCASVLFPPEAHPLPW